MYAAQKKCWNQRKLPRHSLIIISSFTAVDLDYTANLMPMDCFGIFITLWDRGMTLCVGGSLLGSRVG